MTKQSAYYMVKLLSFYLVACLLFVLVDPGLTSWIHSLAYDIREGHSILGRTLVLLLTSCICVTPLLVSSKVVRTAYIILLMPFMLAGMVFVFVSEQFSLWEASIMVSEWSFGVDALKEFLPTLLTATAMFFPVYGS